MKTETKMRNPVWYSILTTLILFINPSSTTITLAFKSVHNLQIKQRLSTNVVTLRPASTRFSVGNPNERENDEYENESLRPSLSSSISRRRFIPVATTVTTGIILTSSSHSAQALYEVDRKSGELFSSKNQMLGRGGSDAARGVSLTQRQSQATAVSDKKLFSSREPIQDLYNTRFITYLARFLLTFDPPSRAWWIENVPSGKSKQDKESTFASFAESVEVGLADYFLGPYGSYASVQAAKAGISAAAPANSFQTKQSNSPTKEKEKKKIEGKKYVKERRQGIINLLALLQARYTAKEEKLQLAILFSFITDPALQPTKQITALLGESDNASIESIEIVKDKYMTVDKKNYKESKIEEVKRNMELNTHGGYSINQIPKITISPPPALGKDYKCAIAKPIMRQTSRILKIRVTDGGSGYKSAPTVTVSTGKKTNDFQPCHAAAILGRDGEVDEIIVLNPGFGYADEGITVQISPPSSKNSKKKKTFMTATASAELEYEISRIDLINGGNGYVSSAFPEISISIEPPADDPDWVLPDSKLPLTEQFTQARVTQTRDSTNTVIDVKNGDYSNKDEITENKWRTILADLKRDPTKVLPNSLRPQLRPASDSLLTSSVTSTTAIAATITSQQNMLYTVPLFTSIPDNSKFYNKLQFSPLFRDVDPIFGGLGIAPVTKRAMTLGVNEYTRLALSGAICTVLVRTLLNPLELVKTKIQLKNDLELLEFASQKAIKTGPRTKEVLHNRLKPDNPMADTNVTESSSLVQTLEKTEIIHKDKNTPKAATTESSTFGTISSMIELRGPQSLFQSADVTFLASLVFGSLGFGATELFRRSFTLSFFEGGDGESELIILLAAAVATIVTSFAASPFEMMRVRSMGLVEPKAFGEVLGEFLKENKQKRMLETTESQTKVEMQNLTSSELTWRDIEFADLVPLFSGFVPVASRELPFAVAKFLAFDTVAKILVALVNSQPGAIPIQVGVGTTGLAISAFSGAIAGIAGAFISHPADLVLTLTSASSKEKNKIDNTEEVNIKSEAGEKLQNTTNITVDGKGKDKNAPDWRRIVQDLLKKEGGAINLFVGFPARATFFFLVIGLQFFLYDYVKNLLEVGSDDLTLVLDVFYAVRQGLVEMDKLL